MTAKQATRSTPRASGSAEHPIPRRPGPKWEAVDLWLQVSPRMRQTGQSNKYSTACLTDQNPLHEPGVSVEFWRCEVTNDGGAACTHTHMIRH